MRRKSIAKLLLFSVLSATVVSCEEDFTEMGSEIIDSDQFGFDKYLVQNITTTNAEAGVANTRNLPINSLGVYNHSAFGKTTAHFVTQIEMKSDNTLTSVGENPVLDSVYVYIPYTSTVSSTDSDGNKSYDLKNTFGKGKFTLNVYENGYFLRNTDPGNDFETQFYYADEKKVFDQYKKVVNGTERLNNATSSAQNTEFSINSNEIKLYAYNADGTPQEQDGNPKVKERLAPGIWLDLDKNYFQSKFFANNKYKSIINNGVLKEYFRGLYFEAVDAYNQNALAQLDLSKGKVVFVYKADGAIDATTNQPKRERKTLEFGIGYFQSSTSISVSATTVNLLESNFDLDNNSTGNLWLKGGGNTTYATISLFGKDNNNSGKADELETLIDNKWLVNQALLTLYVDHAATGLDTISTPKQLFLYDFKNNKVLADYLSDTSANKPVFGGGLNKSNSSVHKYQFRLTDHINNLIQKDSTNVPLGLVVAQDINNAIMNPVRNVDKKTPLTATMNPFGTVIYGPNTSNSDLRMKLEIYYTKEK